jgi:CBS domain-containing protein
MGGATVLQAKRFGVYSCKPQHTLLQAAERMIEESISSLIVLGEQGELVGIITRTDILRGCRTLPQWREALIEDHMTRDVISVNMESSIEQAVDLIVQHRIDRVVVVAAQGSIQRPVAVVSTSDLLYALVQQTS